MAAGSDNLTAKQRIFCAEYLADLNGTAAAIRAGYGKAGARTRAARLLDTPAVAEEIKLRMDERAERAKLKSENVIEELRALAFYDIGAFGAAGITGPADLAKLPEELRRAIIGWSWDRHGNFTLKLSGKTQALEMLGRHLRMFTDKHELSGPDGGRIPVQGARTSGEREEFARAVFRAYQGNEPIAIDEKVFSSLAELIASFERGDAQHADAERLGRGWRMIKKVQASLRPPAFLEGTEQED